MRNISLSKYLSKVTHLFTIFVYLFTFLGPSLALATHAQSYSETYTIPGDEEEFVIRLGANKTPSASENSSEQQAQEEQFINISKGWGTRSLYFGIGQDVQHLVSPLILSQGELPYEEVIEQGLSLGFRGTLEDFGQFFCCWDGRLLINGDYSKGRPSSRFIPSLENESSLTDEAARALLMPYLKKEVEVTADDEWSCYSTPLSGIPLNDTFKVHLEKRIKVAWHDLANRLQGAFLPLITSLGLDQKADWDLKDYINVVSKSAVFLRKYKTTEGADLEESLAFLKGHLNPSSLDRYTTKWIVLQDEMAEEVLALWTQLAQNIGDEFTSQAKQSELDDVTFLSFQTLASFVDDFLNHIEETTSDRTPYSRDIPSLFLDTFAPVTFSNFIAKAVKANAERIFFRGENEIETAILTPTTLSDLEAFCQVSVGSSAVIKDLTLTKGAMTNLGDFEGARATIGQQASFVNGGKAHIQDLRGQGLFVNHGYFEGLVRTSILRFINQTNTFFAPQAESHFENVSVAGVTSQFLNDEGALLEAKKITFEENKLFPSDAVQNKGTFVVHEGITLKGRDFVNGGDATLTGVDLHDAKVINEEHQTISGVRSLKLSGNSTVKNAGTFETKGVVAYDIFKLLANQEQGHWEHQGDVELDEEETAITGSVSLNNGFFIGDSFREIVSSGTLKLHDFSQSNELFFINNEGQMVISGLRKDTPQFSFMIANKHGASLLLTENQGPPLGSFSIDNSGEVELSSSNGLTHWIYNGLSGRVSFKKGIYRLATFLNRGKVDFEASNWHVGQESLRNSVVFASDEFVEEANFLDHVNSRPDTNVDHQIFSGIVFPKNLTFRLPYSLGQIEVSGYLHLPLLQSARPRTLEDLKDVTCHGKTHIALKELTLTENLTFEKLRSLHITCSEAIKIQARLQALQIFINGQKGFDLGVDNDHFGEVVATSGRLGITVQDALNAKYGRLYSMQKMHLRSKTDRVDIGEMILVDSDAERWLGYAHDSKGNGATTKFYSPNGSMISSPSTIHIMGKQSALTGAKIYTGKDLIFACEQDVDIITSILEGQGKCVFDTPKTSIHRKDKEVISVASWECANDCGFTWNTNGSAIMSDQAVVNFKEEIAFQSEEVFLSSCALHAGTDIKYLEGSNKVVEALTETSEPIQHGCKRHKRRRHYSYPSTTSKTYPTVEQSGQEITMALGDGSFVGLNLNTQHFTFRAQTGSFRNPTTHRETVEQVAIEVDLPTYLRELTRQGATMMRLGDDGGISPVFPMAGTSAESLSDLPIVCTQSWQSLEGIGAFNPLENIPLEMLMQRAMGRFAGQLHMGGLSGGSLFNQIYRNSRDFSTRYAESESDPTQLTYYRGALQKSSVPLLYYVSKLVDSRKEVHLHLHIPGEDVNPYQDAGDLSATDVDMETVNDLSCEGTRIVGIHDVFMGSTEGAVDRRGYVDRQGEREFAGCANEVISKEGSVITKTKTGISDRHSKIKAEKKIVQKTDGTIFLGTNIVQDHTSDGRTTRDTVTHLQSEFEGEVILNDGERLIEQAPILRAKERIYYKLREGITSHSATNSAHEETHIKKKKALGGSSSRDEEIHTEDILQPEYHAPHVIFETEKKDISLEAPLVRTKVLEFKAPEGKLVINSALKSFLHSVQTTNSSFAWNKMVNKGETSTTVVGADIEGDRFIFDLKDGIEYSLRADQQAVETNFHGALKKQKNVIWRAIQDEHDSWYDCQESLGGPLAAVIAIAVSCISAGSLGPIVAGMASSLFAAGGTAAAAFTAATTAALSSLASQSVVSFISNKGNIGKVFKELTSSEALRALAVSIAIAGISAGACEALNVETASKVNVKNVALSKAGKATVQQSFVGRVHEATIRAGVQTGVRSTLGKENFGDVLLQAARSATADIGGGFLAQKVGNEYKLDESSLNKLTHRLAHGIIGAGMGAISDGEAFAGMIGAVVAETVGEAFADSNPDVFDPTHADYDPSKRSDYVRNGTALAQISAATAAAFLGQDPNVAAHTALNAVTENAFNPYNPTPIRYSQHQIGDIAAEVDAQSEGVSKEEKIDKMQSSLEKRLPGLGLTKEEGRALATSLVDGISRADHKLSAEEMNAVALRSYIDLRGKPIHIIAIEKVVDYIEDDIVFHADAGEELGSNLGTFFCDDAELQQSFGEVGRKFGIAVGILGMVPNPASLTKKAVMEGIKQAAKSEAKKKIKKKTAEQTTKKVVKDKGKEKVHIVYTKKPVDPSKGTYTGRTSGKGDIKSQQDLDKILRKRDRNHHMNKEGYRPAEVESKTTSAPAARGQEQINIDKMGGAQSSGGTSGNKINGISPKNPKAATYFEAAVDVTKESL